MGVGDELSRRRLLGGTAAVAAGFVVGCSSSRESSRSGTSESAGPEASTSSERTSGGSLAAEAGDDIALVVDAIASEETLDQFSAAAAKAHPGLAPLLSAFRARGEAHVLLLRSALVDLDPAPVRRSEPVARTEQATRSQLVSLTHNAEKHRLADCLASESGSLARVFASMSASHAAAGTLLRETSPRRDR